MRPRACATQSTNVTASFFVSTLILASWFHCCCCLHSNNNNNNNNNNTKAKEKRRLKRMKLSKITIIVATSCLAPLPFCLCFSSSGRSRPINGVELSQHSDDTYYNGESWNRRSFVISTLIAGYPSAVQALASPEPRSLDVGGGFDLFNDRTIFKDKDVMYPPSMEGLWICDRIVTLVEGDRFQAGETWKAVGGGGDLTTANNVESFQTRFIKSPLVEGVVNDRGFEYSQRKASSSNVIWMVEQPDILEYDKGKKLVVKDRKVEVPSDQGFGFNELVRIDDGFVIRAVQIKRRYRRSFDNEGNRLVEGLEIMKTFRVLDGVAGTEFPTSTVKSQIRLRRPPSQ